MVMQDDRLLLGLRDAARVLGVCQKTLWSWTTPRGPIPCARMGSRVLYPVDGLKKWITEQTAAAEEVKE
jgi:hypothetical protein